MDLVGKITFSQYYEDGQEVTHTIRGDSSLDEVVEAFEYFLKGAGYHLPDGCHIGYEYEDEEPREDDTDYKAMADSINLSEVTFGDFVPHNGGVGSYSSVDAWDNITVNSAIDGVDSTDSITINLSDYTPKSEK